MLTGDLVITDSATVYNWVNISMTEEKRVRTKGAAELLIKRRLGTLKSIIQEFSLNIVVELIGSQKNKADVLTRVPGKWLKKSDNTNNINHTCCVSATEIRALHNEHHFGVNRSYYLAKQVYPDVNKNVVVDVVKSCQQCQSIDPAPVTHTPGEISIDKPWYRLAIDVTHFHHRKFLTVVDCGPGRFALWRELKHETVECIVAVLNQIFEERGPAQELLMDNAAVFKSRTFEKFCQEWNVQRYFRAAYRPHGNGIIERHHRTIKSISERANIDPTKAVFWYNCTPRKHLEEQTVPYRSVYVYDWINPLRVVQNESIEDAVDSRVELGDEVWVKPPNARCTSHWGRGVVTNINSNNNVSVDGVPRHILDVRRVVLPVDDIDLDVDDEDEDGSVAGVNDNARETVAPLLRRSARHRRPPCWANDYVM